MKKVTLTDAKANLDAYIEECSTEGTIVITRNGKPIGVLMVPSDSEDLYRLVLGRSRRFNEFLEKSRQSLREGRGMSSEEFWKAAEERALQRAQAKKRKPRKQSA